MAEYVEQSVEEMLGELEEMSRIGLFTDQERRIILKKRKAFEYKLRRKTKAKEDYLRYIQYEINLLSVIKKRTRQMRGGSHYKRIQYALVTRILKLFWLATTRFKADEMLWLSYIEFAKQQGQNARVTRIFTDMLKILNRNPKLWVMAASWEFESCGNPTSARTLIQRGLRFNAESQLIWSEYYKMELMLTQKVLKVKESDPDKKIDVSDAVLSGKVARVVFENAVEAFPGDVHFVIRLLRVSELFDFTMEQQEEIISRLREKFGDRPETWDTLARRRLDAHLPQGYSQQMEECHSIYREGVTKLPTESMWKLYLQFCHESILSSPVKTTRDKNVQVTLDLYKEAADVRCLSSELYLTWVNSLLKVGQVDVARAASSQSLKLFPDNAALWLEFLQILISHKCAEISVMKVFKKAKKSIQPKESWPVWRIVLEYLLSINSSQLTDLLEEGSTSPVRELCLPVKEWYLEWSTLSHSPADTRQLYKQLTQKSSTSLQFYYSYLNFELNKEKPKVKRLRDVYEQALRTYGTSNVDLWLNYMQFERTRGDPINVGHIYERAIRGLAEEWIEGFVARYTLSQTTESK